MKRPVNFFQVIPVEVQVNFGRCDAFVAKHFLNCAKIGSSLNEMCCKTMSESMRTNCLVDSGSFHQFFYFLKYVNPAQPSTSSIQKNNFLILSGYLNRFSNVIHINFKVLYRGGADRNIA